MGPIGAQQEVVQQGQQSATQQGQQNDRLGTQLSAPTGIQSGKQSQQLKDTLFQSDVFERAGKQGSVGGQSSSVGGQSSAIGTQR